MQRTIGTFPEEDQVYILAVSLMIILPSALLVLSLLEIGLFLLYNTKMHPWKALLVGPFPSNTPDNGESDAKNDTESDLIESKLEDQKSVNDEKKGEKTVEYIAKKDNSFLAEIEFNDDETIIDR